MTAATHTAAPRAAAADRARAPRRRRRWHRIVIPFGVVAALVTTTLVAQALDRPDPGDPGYLSPVETDDHGASRLAEALRRRGVTVQRETDTAAALRAARSGPATLFVPAPQLLRPHTLARLAHLPGGTRLVLVDPSRRVLVGVGLPLTRTDRRWATRAVGPETAGRPCPLAELAPVRRAAAERQRYAPDGTAPVDLCFAAGLARLPGAGDTLVVGADDPFRNDRIGERDNQALAVGVLAAHGRVVWLDLAGPEPPPPSPSGARPTWPSRPDGPPGGTATPDPGATGGVRPGTPGDGDPGGGRPPQGSADDGERPPNPLWGAFPPWFWALLVQLALALLVAALWRARRLGPPAPEPLPVTVRSAETALGRARLYQRAGARGPAGRTLRATTLARLLPWLNLPADTPPERVARAVAARTGGDPEQIEDLLYGDDPDTDQELLDLARSLDALSRTVAASAPTQGRPAGAPPPPDPTEGGTR